MTTTPATVHFYFDIVCPYAYLASTKIERVCEEGGAKLVWKPMLLGGVLNAVNGPDYKAQPISSAKAGGNDRDLRRQAESAGVTLKFPEAHPMRTVDVMRLITAAQIDHVAMTDRAGEVQTLIHDLYRAYWVEGRDLTNRAVLAEIAFAHHIDPSVIDRDDVKARLRATTDEALADGVFGAPSFVVESESGKRLIFGQDRLFLVEQAIRGELGKPVSSTTALPPAATSTGRVVTFFYDFVSPYTYLASTQIEALARRTGATIEWRPVLLGAVFKELGMVGVPLNNANPTKRMYAIRDMYDCAAYWGVPFNFPASFPILTTTALRVCLLLDDKTLPPVAHAIFRAFWSEGRDISDSAVLAEILSAHGLDAADLIARSSAPEIKGQLVAANKAAMEAGVYGLPSFQVDGELYFGQDRFPFLVAALAKTSSS